MPAKNFPLPWEPNHWTVRGVKAPGLTDEESAVVTVQALGRGLLVPGEDYLLWFTFKDEEPRSVMPATRLVPVDSFNPSGDVELGPMMRDGRAFSPEVLARYLKAQQQPENPLKPTTKPTP